MHAWAFNALPGLPFPAPREALPAKDAAADRLTLDLARHRRFRTPQ